MKWTTLEQGFGHARNYVRLRNGLTKPDWQRGVFVGAATECLVHKDVTRHISNTIQHRQVCDALITEPLH
jgi:hypothetical protein